MMISGAIANLINFHTKIVPTGKMTEEYGILQSKNIYTEERLLVPFNANLPRCWTVRCQVVAGPPQPSPVRRHMCLRRCTNLSIHPSKIPRSVDDIFVRMLYSASPPPTQAQCFTPSSPSHTCVVSLAFCCLCVGCCCYCCCLCKWVWVCV